MHTLQKPSFRDSGFPKRKALNLSGSSLFQTRPYDPDKGFLLVIRPAVEGLNLTIWAGNNRDFLESNLYKYGAILFRGFAGPNDETFEEFIRTTSGSLLDYTYRSTPRTRVGGNVFTSTEYPPDMPIFLHNENSYSRNWAMKLFFLCVQASRSGGETPIADSRRMFQEVDPDIKEEFIRKNVMYVRNYGPNIDLPWQDVFQTENKAEVEEYCHKSNMICEWLDRGRLRTKQVCQAVAEHPRTGEMVWFNQANLFHVSCLPREVQNSLLRNFGEDALPRNAYFGNGDRIESQAISHINQVYQRESVNFPWQEGDILMLDNMLTAHGRNPFTGPRKIVVGMAEPYSSGVFGLD